MEYVDVEGLIQPILTIKVNTREAGSVERIIAEEGSLLQKGDTILTLSNPDLLRSIEDQRDDWEKQRITYQEKEIEMEQKSLSLKQQTLETNYELARLKKSFTLDKEEFRMGIKSKAQLEVSELQGEECRTATRRSSPRFGRDHHPQRSDTNRYGAGA